MLVALAALALVTRLVWNLWIHPPGDYVFSDMGQYVLRAQKLADEGFVWGQRNLAWQSFGTHYLLAAVFKVFGGQPPFRAASIVFALLGAAAVPLAYLLACRVVTRRWIANAAGVLALLWYPNLSTTGYFLSETPFLFFQLLSTYWMVITFQEGRRAVPAGIAAGVSFMLRPQTAVFFALVFVTWLVNVRGLPKVRARQVVGFAAPLLLALLYSLWRFSMHTGYWGGVAESANMNLTAGRCHNIVTQAFADQGALERSVRRNNTRDGRRVSVPGLRALGGLPPSHPLALRPALEAETIRFVGYIGDPFIHREFQRRCVQKTGLLGQLRYAAANLSLQWFFAKQWPDQEPKARPYFMPIAEVYRYLFAAVFLIPSLVGMGMALRRLREDPVLALLGWQIFSSVVIAAIFFGDVRLRTPYDPYALILALVAFAAVGGWIRELRRRRVS